jgi:hypothetical protein
MISRQKEPLFNEHLTHPGRTVSRSFPARGHGRERGHGFLLAWQSILVPVTVSRTSNLLRGIAALFGARIAQSRDYAFMASLKLPWAALWAA